MFFRLESLFDKSLHGSCLLLRACPRKPVISPLSDCFFRVVRLRYKHHPEIVPVAARPPGSEPLRPACGFLLPARQLSRPGVPPGLREPGARCLVAVV